MPRLTKNFAGGTDVTASSCGTGSRTDRRAGIVLLPGSVGRVRAPRIIGAMLLAIDIGNSNITTGLFQNGLLVATRRAATDRTATPDELELLIEGLLGLDTLDLRGASPRSPVPRSCPA